jgi:hypothetical protein
VRIALRQKPQGSGRDAEAVERQRRAEETGRTELARLHHIAAEMLIEPRPPLRLHAVAGLQDRLQAPRAPAMHEAEMAAVRARHQFEDDARFAVLPRPEDEALVRPLHRCPIRHRAGA